MLYVLQYEILRHIIFISHVARCGPAHRPQMPRLHYIAGRPNIPEGRDSIIPELGLSFDHITKATGKAVADRDRIATRYPMGGIK